MRLTIDPDGRVSCLEPVLDMDADTRREPDDTARITQPNEYLEREFADALRKAGYPVKPLQDDLHIQFAILIEAHEHVWRLVVTHECAGGLDSLPEW